MGRKPDLAIIGPGRVGMAVGLLARRAGWRVSAVAGRDQRRTRRAACRLRARAVSPEEAAGAASLVLLTVPDDAIEPLCCRLARRGAFRRGAVVAHCSGALDRRVLAAAKRRGCAVGSAHPMQTFPTAAVALRELPGAWWFVEGEARAARVLRRLGRALGCRVAAIDPRRKTLYHAAAVLACNYASALMDAAMAAAREAGIPRRSAGQALEPLVRATIDNIFRVGPAGALTGPIARGDLRTVRRHLSALRRCPKDLRELYRSAGVWTVRLALRKGTIRGAAARALRRILNART